MNEKKALSFESDRCGICGAPGTCSCFTDRLARVFHAWLQRHYPDYVWVRAERPRPTSTEAANAAREEPTNGP